MGLSRGCRPELKSLFFFWGGGLGRRCVLAALEHVFSASDRDEDRGLG